MRNGPLMLRADAGGSRHLHAEPRAIETPTITKLGEALRLLRVLNDMKQNELAAHLNLSKSYLSEIERGHKVPSTEVVENYAAFFKIPVSSIWFFHEQIAQGPNRSTIDRAKGIVADRVLNLLRVLEERAKLAEETDQL